METATGLMNGISGGAMFHSMHSMVILGILACCSLLSLAFIFERWLYFRRISVNSDEVLLKVRDSLIGGRVEEALGLLGNAKNNPVMELIQTGVKSSRLPKEQVAEMMRICEIRQRASLERNLGLLGTLGNVAPFIGLLGTVMGIIQAFQDLASPQAQAGGATVVAVGISEALIATAAGLAVAIPSVVCYNFFLRKAKGVIMQMDIAIMEISVLLSMKEAPGANGGRNG